MGRICLGLWLLLVWNIWFQKVGSQSGMGWIWGPLVISSPDCTVISLSELQQTAEQPRDWRRDRCGEAKDPSPIWALVAMEEVQTALGTRWWEMTRQSGKNSHRVGVMSEVTEQLTSNGDWAKTTTCLKPNQCKELVSGLDSGPLLVWLMVLGKSLNLCEPQFWETV